MENNILVMLLNKYPFFGEIIANVTYKETTLLDTIGTDGEVIYYNSTYLNSFKDADKLFLLAHEICHIAFNHILRSEGKSLKTWNLATDAIINQLLFRDGLNLVNGAVNFPGAINYSAEELYDKLISMDSVESISNNGNKESNSKSSFNKKDAFQDVGHDTHFLWKKEIYDKKNNHDLLSKENLLFDILINNKPKNQVLQNKKDELSQISEQDAFALNEDKRKESIENIKDNLIKKVGIAGDTTNSDIRRIDNIGRAKPLIDWRYVLKESINYEVDWSYKNATLVDGVVSANLEEYPVPQTEIVIDTSGSIDDLLLKNFLRECKNILKYTKMKVGCFDTKFYGFKEIKNYQDIEDMEFIGGGGTDFDVAIKAFSKRVDNKIILTDGLTAMPATMMNAIWIVYGDVHINPLGGKVIYIKREELKNKFNYDKLN